MKNFSPEEFEEAIPEEETIELIDDGVISCPDLAADTADFPDLE